MGMSKQAQWLTAIDELETQLDALPQYVVGKSTGRFTQPMRQYLGGIRLLLRPTTYANEYTLWIFDGSLSVRWAIEGELTDDGSEWTPYGAESSVKLYEYPPETGLFDYIQIDEGEAVTGAIQELNLGRVGIPPGLYRCDAVFFETLRAPRIVPVNGGNIFSWIIDPGLAVEIILGIFLEPADWFYSARDLSRGEWTALIGILPLVPGNLGPDITVWISQWARKIDWEKMAPGDARRILDQLEEAIPHFRRQIVEQSGDEAAETAERAFREEVERGRKLVEDGTRLTNRLPTATDTYKGILNDYHLEAARRELQGEVVRINPRDGLPYDHVQEILNAQRGLRNRIDAINRQLSDVSPSRALSEAERQALIDELSEASRLLDYSEKFVPPGTQWPK